MTFMRTIYRSATPFLSSLAANKRRHFFRSFSNICEPKALEKGHFTELLTGKILALSFPSFISENVANQSIRNLSEGNLLRETSVEGLKIAGNAYFETFDNQSCKQKYYATANTNRQAIRVLFHPYQNPLDKLQLQLKKIWKPGVEIENLGEGEMFSGMIQSICHGFGMMPHEDKLSREDRSSKQAASTINQLAAIIFLQLPEKGGELEIWGKSCSDKEYDLLRGQSYGISHEKLPFPDVTIQPQIGHLVVFKSTNLHAVRKVFGKNRISMSVFINHYGNDKPLRLWS
jgi:hypothetical protein